MDKANSANILLIGELHGRDEAMSSKQRSSNIELLRIVTMLMIIAHHFAFHGGFAFNSSSISTNLVWIQFLRLGGKIGVDIFVLISGYYLVTRVSFKAFKALKLWIQMLFYSVGIYLVAVGLNITAFSKKAMIETLFPVTSDLWWFASSYFMLFLLSPLINKVLNFLSKRQCQIFLLIALFVWCIIPSITAVFPALDIVVPESNLLWFVILYSVTGYIRLWHTPIKGSALRYLSISLCTFILTLLSAIGFDYLNTIQDATEYDPCALFEMTSITILITSLTAVLGFLQIDLKRNNIINIIASATFGVYLIHDHPIIRTLLWKSLFKNATYASSKLLIPYSVVVIIIVYLASTVIELVRIYTIEQFYIEVTKKLLLAFDKAFNLMRGSIMKNF